MVGYPIEKKNQCMHICFDVSIHPQKISVSGLLKVFTNITYIYNTTKNISAQHSVLDPYFDLWRRNFISKEALFEPNFCDKSLLHLVRSTTQLRRCWEVNQMSHEDRLLCHLLLQNATKRGQNGLLTRNSINSTTRVLNDRNSCPDSTLF